MHRHLKPTIDNIRIFDGKSEKTHWVSLNAGASFFHFRNNRRFFVSILQVLKNFVFVETGKSECQVARQSAAWEARSNSCSELLFQRARLNHFEYGTNWQNWANKYVYGKRMKLFGNEIQFTTIAPILSASASGGVRALVCRSSNKFNNIRLRAFLDATISEANRDNLHEISRPGHQEPSCETMSSNMGILNARRMAPVYEYPMHGATHWKRRRLKGLPVLMVSIDPATLQN